ncbi:autotransporter-associated beta strand repeat-containing protein [Ensifer adhaerens]|uniref:autotransporter-associated beta strand repeat-containing protein n=1 Tax=Ensifer adhaerens TaxID=106592 RepID=UPI0015C3A949|nr:autotransporter-associated beta strand repeat-containing protein [Ensifer adhaerens]
MNTARNDEARANRSALRVPALGVVASLAATLANSVAPLALIVASGPALADSIGQNGAAGGNAPNYSTAAGGGGAGAAGDGSATGTGGGGGSTGGSGNRGGSGGASDSGGGGGGGYGLGAGGGGGGAGGAGMTLTTGLVNNATIKGGNGGNGGYGNANWAQTWNYAGGGGGGGGGSGIIVTTGTSLTNSGVISGGNGGGGADVSGPGIPNSFANPSGNGVGGNGGNGITATASSGLTISNSGTIQGGGGGTDYHNVQPYRPQAGGYGIIGQNLTITNSGTIAGGARGGAGVSPGSRSSAIVITGGTNSITALTASSIGAIELNGGATTLAGAFNDTVQVSGGATLALGVAGDATGFTSLSNAGGTITIGDGNTLSAGTIANFSGGRITLGVGSVLFGTGNTLNNDATIDVGTDGVVMDNGDINNNAAGIINFNGPGGTAQLSPGTNNVNNSGQINVVGGDVDVRMSNINNQGTGLVSLVGGDMFGVSTLTNSGTATLNITAGRKLSLQTLAFNGGTISGTGTIEAANGFNLWGNGTVGATLAGAANLTRGGPGTTILTGNHTYTGGTTVTAGELQLGTAGTAGSIRGQVNVLGAGTFTLTNADATGISSITNAGKTYLYNASSAASATIANTGELYFYDTSSAGSAIVTNNNVLEFHDTSTAGNSNITNNSNLLFHANSRAGTATIGNNSGSVLNFHNTSSADNARITNDAVLSFYDSSTAGSADITNNRELTFYDASGAGSARMTNNDTLTFRSTTTAGSARIANNASLAFLHNSNAGNAEIANGAAGIVDFSGSTGSAGNKRLTAGSIAGGGSYLLGDNELTVGSNGLSTEVSGTISGNGGSLVKAGTGTLTLTGENTYSGGTTVAGGTLRIGNGGATGSILGDVVNDGALAFNRSDAFTFSGAISGSGSVRQIGSGTTILTGNNSYGGGTTISGGVLQLGNGGVTGSITGDVVNDGVLAFNRSNAVTFSGAISGSGSVRQIGSGTTILTGTNTYTGGTTISGGALQLGNGGATGSILGDVVNDGVLAFNRSDAVTFSGAVSGNGSVRQIGSGTTILTGTNTYTGGTTISGGTLQLGSGGATGSITGNVVNDGVLAFKRSDAVTFSGGISGSGAVRQIGSGTTILTGSNSYTGDTTVSGGRLQFGSGSNTLGGNLIVTGGTLAIQAPAAVNVAQAVTFGDNTALSIVAGTSSPPLSADRLTIGNGVGFNIGGINDASQLDKVLIDTRSGISGDFASVSVGGFSGAVDYLTMSTRKSADNLQYLASYGLTWTAGNNLAHGTFTLSNATDSFTVGAALADQVANPATGWNGTSLTKAGAGTLTLTGDNTYSGGTTISGGVLQLGNGGTSGSILGDVVNDGVLAFIRSDALTFSGAVSGNGAVRQIGLGTTILTGSNSYTGGTTVAGGTLQVGNGGATGSILGNVINDGVLAFNRADTLTFSGAISGSGSVRQIGSGTTVLTGNNSYTGGTTAAGGTLQLGNGGATGSITGNVVNDSMLAFNRSDALTFSGAVSGSGAVRQIGTGTTALTGNNSYTGGTTISGGTLQLGNGGATGSVTGNVVNNGVLAFNRSDTFTFAGAVSGSGAVRQIGSGTTILTGSNAYMGDTTVSGGRLQFGDGSAGVSNSLGGNLTVTGGALAIQTPATLTVERAVTLGDNTALSVVAGTTSPTLTANRVTIGNGVALSIGGINDASQLDKVLIDTRSGIVGDFASVTVGGFSGTVDYLTVSARKSADSLQYLASYGLSWTAGNNLAHGSFTLTDATDSFTVGAALADQVANPATGWNGTSLTKAGAGTLTLTGSNSYTGGTTIVGGVLSVSRDANLGAATGGLTLNGGTLATTASFDTARSIALMQPGRFDIAAATEVGLTGTASGSGDLIKQGAGTLRLDNGANAYGNTLVAAGTLIGNASSISGNIGNAGMVVFDQAGDAAFAGDIGALNGSGGRMNKRGAGILSLTGLSSLDWTVEAGRLVGAAERFGGNTHLSSGGSLTFDQALNASYGGVISGSGSFAKAGAGRLTLTGNSSAFSGTTTVESGTLAVNGSLGGTVDVLAGGRLQGAGSVSNAKVSGAIAPGNSIGTLNIGGNVTLAAGSLYEVEVNATGQSDKIVATGTATIAGGSVNVLAATGSYAPQTQYTILTAKGGRSGTFSGVNSNFAFLDPSLSYDANNVYLKLTRNNIDFSSIGLTPNQIATGDGVESLGRGNPVYNAVTNLSAPQARNAFDQLSGEIHASAKSALTEDSRFIRNAMNDRIRAAFESTGASKGPVTTYVDGEPVAVDATTDRLAFWSHGFGSWAHTDGDGNAARLDRSTGGFFAGADVPAFDNWRFGAIAGYSHTSFDVKDRFSSGSSENYHAGLYGGTNWGDLAFRTGAAYTWHDVSTSRTVMFPGFNDNLKGDYDAGTAQVFGELGYGFAMGAARFEPFANLAHVSVHTDAFTEKGGAAALNLKDDTTDSTLATLGLRASTAFDLNGAAVTVKGLAGWRHAFGDVLPLSTMRFAGGGDAFSIAGVPIARDVAVVEAGLDYALSPNATLGVTYAGQFGSDVSDQSARINLNVSF